MRNKYPGNCCICGNLVKAGAGHFEIVNHKKIYMGNCKKRWFVRCKKCVGKGAPWEVFVKNKFIKQ